MKLKLSLICSSADPQIQIKIMLFYINDLSSGQYCFVFNEESALTLWLDLFSPLQALHGIREFSRGQTLPNLSAQSRIINGREKRHRYASSFYVVDILEYSIYLFILSTFYIDC